jgi:dienelactone hydrolase
MTSPVLVEEVELADQPPGFLVRPATAASSHPAVLWLHWLGHNRSDRTQFLPEAVRLAQQGVVSLLPQGVFRGWSAPRATPQTSTRSLRRPGVHAPPSTTSTRTRSSTRSGSRWSATTTARCSR